MQRHQQPVNWDHENHRENLAAKPLPRLPRGWARICYETSLLLRGLGLGVVVSAFQGLFSKNFSEPAKIAIRRNRITACLRNLIHTVPLGIALFEIILNWKGRYVGAQVLNPNYLQFAAKAHEVTVQISVATIILSYVRHHVVNKGMPFGAVLAGLQIFQPNYLWSLEFWASMSSKNYQLNRKLPFAFLVLACILVTILAGPSSANLLIARHGIWRTKSAYIAFNATFQDIWPDQLDGEDVPKSCAVANLGSLANDPDCPLSNLLFSLGTSAFEMSQENPSKQLSFVDQNSTLGFIKQMTVASCSSSPKDQFCASSSQEVILGGLVIDSFSQPQFKDRTSCIDGYQRIQEGYYQPYTAATCVSDVIKKSSGQEPLRFPRLSETESELSHDREIISVSDITKGQAMQISGNISQYLVNWVDLPQNLSNGMPGVVIIHPHNPGQSLVNITACTLAAGWGTSEVSTHFQDLEKMYSQMIDIPSSWGIHDNVVDTYGYVKRSWPDFGTRSNFSYPQRRINISRKWAEFLDPTIILPDNSNSTSISLFLTELQSSPSEDDVARILSATFASGLSMVGLKYDWEVFQNISTATAAVCNTCLVLKIHNSIFGWTYTVDEITTKLSVCVMLVYCILVLAHMIYSVFSGVSSTAWDSVAELLVLAMNSSSTEILQNTCAGIVGKKVFETHVRILATDKQHLELVFGEETEATKGSMSSVMINEEYGRLVNRKSTKVVEN